MIGSASLPVAMAAMSAERPADPWYDVVEFDDGTLRVRGKLPPHVQAQLERTHVDTGRRIDRWAVWVSREAGDDS